MSGRGGSKRRGRPPKTPSSERTGGGGSGSAQSTGKFQYHLMKKPKYLLNRGSDSQLSTPTASRASSPHGSTDSSRPSMPRPSTSRLSVTGGSARKGRAGTSSAATTPAASGKRGKAAQSATPYSKKEYLYGSDFGESSDEADADDDMLASQSESDSLIGDAESESDFSLSSFSSCTQQQKRQRQPTPEPLWLQQRDIPRLELPATSDDLLIPLRYALRTAGVYEIMRRFKYLMRLTPFRLEDLCAALVCADQSALLVEVHIALMKAILREEDSQSTHFGPLDQKDSVNISLYLIDSVTWPEILRSYVDSDASNDRTVLDILSNTEYPYCSVDQRLTVLQFLTDQFLCTAAVRDDICKEGPIHYDDHCRICHRLGDLLCCETCPAVFHLECVDPPLVDVPTEDWQCSICKAHQIAGVYDCMSVAEKQGMLCRQDHLGFDRHGRKYWFIARRVFVETEDGAQTWYYSTVDQLEQLMSRLDDSEMEAELCAELNEVKDEIVRHMEITERLTDEMRHGKPSYLEAQNAQIRAELKKAVEGDATTTSSARPPADGDVEMKDADETKPTSDDPSTKEDGDKPEVEGGDSDSSSAAANAKHTTRLKTGTLVQKSYADETKRKSVLPTAKDSPTASGETKASTTTSTAIVPAVPTNSATLYRLGMEQTFKNYSNQFTTSSIALNKPQRNEERDKKRHLSHKFSLTTASEFKWAGPTLTGSQVSLVAALRSTLLSLEQTVSSTFMHPNWQSVRKQWVTAVTSAGRPIDFAKVMVVLLTCFKAPIFANVWHEQLGHVRLQRITAAEREEKKKLEKREKREKDDEEERNRLSVNFVKYSLGLKHQVWKQKGEEYRIHGQWGWVWMSYGRRALPMVRPALGSVPAERINTHKVMVPIERAGIRKIIGIRASTYDYLRECRAKLDAGETVADIPEDIHHMRLVETIGAFAELDVSKALAAPGRLLYPKQAKKSKLDDLLAHRVALRDAEELKLKEIKPEASESDGKTPGVAAAAATPKPVAQLLPPAKIYAQTSIEKQLAKIIATRAAATSAAAQPAALANIDMDFVNALAKSIQAVRAQFGQLNRFGKQYRCYSRECSNQNNSGTFTLPQSAVVNCYSALCLQKSRVKRELLALLRKAHTAGNGSKETVSAIMAIVNRKPSLVEQRAAAASAAASADAGAAQRADDPAKMQKDFREACAISFVYEEEDVSDCISMTETKPEVAVSAMDTTTDVVKKEVKEESEDASAATAPAIKDESEPMEQEPVLFDDQQGSSCAEVEVGGDTSGKDDGSEIKLDPLSTADLSTPDAKRRRINTATSEVSSTIEIPSDDESDQPLAAAAQRQTADNTEAMKTRRRKSPRNVRSTRSLTTTTTTTTSRTTTEYDDGSVEEDSNSSTKTRSRETATDGKRSVTTVTRRQSVGQSKYVAHPNRRFAGTASKSIKKEESLQIVREFGTNGAERVYTVSRSAGRIYLKKTLHDGQTPAPRVAAFKLPVINSYLTRRSTRSLMVLPRHELVKMARCGGKQALAGYHPLAKTNNGCWPYPSSRPQFKTAWFFRTMTMRTLAAVALQLRIVWCCLRWDDMATKPPTNDGKHQVTTETEIMSLEILKYRHCGRFSERTQYLRRKVVIPLELPKTIREFTSIRSGLRKRKRAESPQKTDPQVSEEWVDEDKLELWEIKQFGEKQERANIAMQPITRTSTGKLPTTRTPSAAAAAAAAAAADGNGAGASGNGSGNKVLVSSKATPDEIKEKMEQQLRIQRAAHHQKRALEMKNARPATAVPTAADKPHFIGQRKIVVKNPDGSTKIIQQNIPAPVLKPVADAANAASPTTPNSTAQKVQIIRGPDGKVSVRGLNPGQQLIQMPDGKLHVLTSGQASVALASGQAKTVIRAANSPAPGAIGGATPTKTIVKTPVQNVLNAGVAGGTKQVLVRQQMVKTVGMPGAPIVLNKAAPKGPGGAALLPQQRVIVASNQPTTTTTTPMKSLAQQVSSTSAQKTITAKGQQILNTHVQKVAAAAAAAAGTGSTANLQQLLTQGGSTGQKIVINQATPNRVMVAKQQQQIQVQPQLVQQQQQQLVQVQGQPVMQQQQQQVVVSPGQKILQQYVNESNQQQQIIVNGQRILLAPGQRIITQQAQAQPTQQVVQQQQQQQIVQHVVQQQQPQQQVVQQIVQQQQAPQQQQQQQIVVQQQQSTASPQQLITNNSSLAQQLAQGKLQVATVNGQQVIIKPLGNNQAQIVAHIKTQNDGQAHIVTSSSPAAAGNDQLPDSTTEVQQQQPATPQKSVQQQLQEQQLMQQQQSVQASPQTNSTAAASSSSTFSSTLAPTIEQSLLQGQPPGTVIKCVTAQVIQTPQGPRIVLQGLAGNDFTPQQLSLVQQQVKQQLLKAQETSGKSGVLGPTKIYLAVQPAQPAAQPSQPGGVAQTAQTSTTQPPPLTPVQSPQQQTPTAQPPTSTPTILASAVETTPAVTAVGKLVKIVTNGTSAPVLKAVPATLLPTLLGSVATKTVPAAAAAAAVPTATATATANTTTTPPTPPTSAATDKAVDAVATAATTTTTPAIGSPAVVAPTASSAAATAAVDVKKALANKLKTEHKAATSSTTTTATASSSSEDSPAKDDSFVVTPDYIQQTIKNALKQENLNPEIEEKLLNLQRYQEKQMKSEDVHHHHHHNNSGTGGSSRSSGSAAAGGSGTSGSNASNNHNHSTTPAKSAGGSSRKRPNQRAAQPLNDDDDWVLDTPKRRPAAASGAGSTTAAAASASKTTPTSTTTPAATASTPSKRSEAGGSTETSPHTPAAPVNKRSLAAKKRESDKKKAALAAQMEVQRELKVEQSGAIGGTTAKAAAAAASAAAAAAAAPTSTIAVAAASAAKASAAAAAATPSVTTSKAKSPRKSAGSAHKESNHSKTAKATAAAAVTAVVPPATSVVSSTTGTTAASLPSAADTTATTTTAATKGKSVVEPAAAAAPAPAPKNALTPANPDKRRPVPTHKTTIKTNKPDSTPAKGGHRGGRHHPRAGPKQTLSNKKKKLFCLCRTPYDDTKFYVGCDLCNNWFHGECVGISEHASKALSEFVCGECKHARDTQELYCLCRKPYDESQFYICCDKCQDWFHGRCVGIVQSEADNIDEYICPKCQQNTAVNLANMKCLTALEYEHLRKLIGLIRAHKSAWPFMEPVDADEAPDYYRVIKDPMDLQKIDAKITGQDYVKLSEFIGDMTKIFDNCRFYNAKESKFYRCAESLEGYFVQRIKHFRETLATAETTTAAAAAAATIAAKEQQPDGIKEGVEVKTTRTTTTADAAESTADEEEDESGEAAKDTPTTTTSAITTTAAAAETVAVQDETADAAAEAAS